MQTEQVEEAEELERNIMTAAKGLSVKEKNSVEGKEQGSEEENSRRQC